MTNIITPICVILAACLFLWIMDMHNTQEAIEHAKRLERMKS